MKLSKELLQEQADLLHVLITNWHELQHMPKPSDWSHWEVIENFHGYRIDLEDGLCFNLFQNDSNKFRFNPVEITEIWQIVQNWKRSLGEYEENMSVAYWVSGRDEYRKTGNLFTSMKRLHACIFFRHAILDMINKGEYDV